MVRHCSQRENFAHLGVKALRGSATFNWYIFDFFKISQKYYFFILYTFLSMRVNFQNNLIFFLGKINKIKSYYKTLNSVFRKLWFSVFVTTYVWIKSEVNLNFNQLFFVILSILLGIEITLAKKITTKILFLYFGIFLFIFLFYFIFNSFSIMLLYFPYSKSYYTL